MAQISTQELKRLPLRVHSLMAGVPLHDVWAVDLPRWRGEVTLDDFLRTANNCTLDMCGCSNSLALFTPSPPVRSLLVTQASSQGPGSGNPSTGRLYRLPILPNGAPGTLEQLWESGPAEAPDGGS